MPLIKNFKSTNYKNAFILNSIKSALIIIVAITVKDMYDVYHIDEENNTVTRETNRQSIAYTLLFTFLASLLTYTLMYVIFGYGKGLFAR